MGDMNGAAAVGFANSRRKLMLCIVRTPNRGCQICRAFVISVREGTRKENPQLEEKFAKHQRRLADTKKPVPTMSARVFLKLSPLRVD